MINVARYIAIQANVNSYLLSDSKSIIGEAL